MAQRPTYVVELLFAAERPTVDMDKFRDRVGQRIQGASFATDETGAVVVEHPGGRLTKMLVTDPSPPAVLSASASQSWSWPHAARVTAQAKSSIWLLEPAAVGEPQHRLDAFFAVLLGALEASRCLAVHWRLAGRIVPPTDVLGSQGHGSPEARFMSAINVRMMLDAQGGRWMDTMGLVPFGLPDLQVPVDGLDPGEVVHRLYDLAWQLWEQGPVFTDGDRVPGTSGHVPWVMHHRTAALPPARPVLALTPELPEA